MRSSFSDQNFITAAKRPYLIIARANRFDIGSPMPRPRKNDPTPLIKPILVDFAREIANAVERLTLERVRAVLDGGKATEGLKLGRIGQAGRRGGSRPTQLCYYPGCKNTAAPRYGMFCVALHKDLPEAEKEKYRKQHHDGNGAKPAAAAKRRGKKK
jgi:hypothetical protein